MSKESRVKSHESVTLINQERSISVVKTRNQDQIDMYEIDVLPKLVYFESEIPTFWPDDVTLQVSF